MDTVNKIQFEKPDIHELNRAYTVADLHFHTHYSDGVNSVHDIARQAEALGIGIAITDHNDIQGAVEIDKCKRILSIPGIEITSREGSHLLVYFYDVPSLKAFYREDLKPYMGNGVMSSTLLEMEDIIRRARRFKTVIMFPHPYCAAYTGVCNLQFTWPTGSRSSMPGILTSGTCNARCSDSTSARASWAAATAIRCPIWAVP